MTLLEEIQAERKRQIEAEGWTAEHDDEHADGELLRAAVHYLWAGTDKAAPIDSDGAPLSWPWDVKWWKPRDRRSNLIRAGALCLAEKDRLGRQTGHVDHKFNLVLAELARLETST